MRGEVAMRATFASDHLRAAWRLGEWVRGATSARRLLERCSSGRVACVSAGGVAPAYATACRANCLAQPMREWGFRLAS